MENELLKDKSDASLRAFMEYAKSTYLTVATTKDGYRYWMNVYNECGEELELRIFKIFPHEN